MSSNRAPAVIPGGVVIEHDETTSTEAVKREAAEQMAAELGHDVRWQNLILRSRMGETVAEVDHKEQARLISEVRGP